MGMFIVRSPTFSPDQSGRMVGQGPKSVWSFLPYEAGVTSLVSLCFVSTYTNITVILLFQTAVPLELPQVKPKRSNDSKGLGMQLKGPLGLGGRGPLSELRSSTAGCPGSLAKDSPRPDPSGGSQKPTFPPQSADHLEEELDLLLNLDAPVKEEDGILPDQTSQDLKSERDGQMAQEEEGMAYILFPIHPLDAGCFCENSPTHITSVHSPVGV